MEHDDDQPAVGLGRPMQLTVVLAAIGSLGFAAQLQWGRLSQDRFSPMIPMQPKSAASTCQDDPNWSAYGNNIYTCRWLKVYDPGCKRNACTGNTDYGQCESCPVSCGTCPSPPPPSPPAVPSNATAEIEEPIVSRPSFAHIAIEVLLSFNGVLGLVLLGLASARSWACAARLATILALASLVLVGLAVGSYAPGLPLVCTAWHSTLVPLSWANYQPNSNVEEGHVVSYRYHGRLYRALEIQVREFDLAAPGCVPQVGLMGLFMLFCLLNLSFCSRLNTNARRASVTDKLVHRMLLSLHRFDFPAAPHPSAAAAASKERFGLRVPGIGGAKKEGTKKSRREPDGARGSSAADGTELSDIGAGAPRAASSTAEAEEGDAPPVTSYLGMETEEGQPAECPICICAYEPGEKVVGLPCNHMLHEECLVTWARAKLHKTVCPLCKASLAPKDMPPDSCSECLCFVSVLPSSRRGGAALV